MPSSDERDDPANWPDGAPVGVVEREKAEAVAGIRAAYDLGLTRAAEIARELKSEAWSHDAARVALDRAGIAIEAERGATT